MVQQRPLPRHHKEPPMALTPFHLAVSVHDLKLARTFYGEVLGCEEGRSCDEWIDFNLFGHQLVVHLGGLSPVERDEVAGSSQVDGHDVPIPHFGVVLEIETFQRFAHQLKQRGVRFVMEPTVRFEGLPGEQHTMFFYDPSGNALEFKAFADIDSQLFET